jgi:citrate lyase subunit beta/citryl-CoA lyase
MSRDVARSYLYVPGNRPERFDKARAAGAVDGTMIDRPIILKAERIARDAGRDAAN